MKALASFPQLLFSHKHADCLIGYCSMMKREKNLQPEISENTPVRTVRTMGVQCMS